MLPDFSAVAVDAKGSVYVTTLAVQSSSVQVVKFAQYDQTATVLFSREVSLNGPVDCVLGVTVDSAFQLYRLLARTT